MLRGAVKKIYKLGVSSCRCRVLFLLALPVGQFFIRVLLTNSPPHKTSYLLKRSSVTLS